MKALSKAEAKNKIIHLKEEGKKIVFTNGCFDLIHKGHRFYLKKAKGLGDYLIVGLNSDSSVAKIKGPDRPINKEETRARNLLALDSVDAVTIFNEETPQELIDILRPNVLVKGGDYKNENIVGADQVFSDGGDVIILPYLPGYSTTKIIEQSTGKGLTEQDASD